jgi:hypothetical protein
MKTRRSSTRVLLIAFAAIVGMLSLADVASACTTKPGRAPRACCVNHPPSECGCCGERQAIPSPASHSRVDAIVTSPAPDLYQTPSPSCECRASEPAAPSERPAQRTTIDRSDMQSREPSGILAPTDSPFPSLGRLQLPNESPPGSPLYLRTSRLLI